MNSSYEEMFKELKRLDPVTYRDLVTFNVNMGLPESCPMSMHIITGCILDACERRGWEITQIYRYGNRHNAVIINGRGYRLTAYHGSGSTNAEALLSAYIKAISSIGSDDIDLANVDGGD